MMAYVFTNFAESKVAAGLSATASQVSVAVADKDLFATFTATDGEVQRCVLYDGVQVAELVDVSLRADEVLDIARAAAGTTARAWGSGSVIRGILSADMMTAAGRTVTGATDQIEITGGTGTTGTTLVGLASHINLASKIVTSLTHQGALTASEFQTATGGAYNFKGNAANAASLQLEEDSDNGTNFLALAAPASLASSYKVVYPNTIGSAGQVLDIVSISTDSVPVVALGWVANNALGTDWADLEEFSAYQLGLGG
jgi:hypothetical protein